MTSVEFHITARATATDCRCPPESVATGCRIERIVVTARVFSVSAVFDSITGSFICWNQLCASRPRYMFWTTSRLSQRARSWYTTSIPSLAASFGPWIETSLPSKRISPLSGVCAPAMHLISVDLPAPLSPTSAITSPRRTSRSTSDSASTEPKVLVMERSSRRGVSVTWRVSYHKGGGGAHPDASTVTRVGLLAELDVRPDADLAPLEE